MDRENMVKVESGDRHTGNEKERLTIISAAFGLLTTFLVPHSGFHHVPLPAEPMQTENNDQGSELLHVRSSGLAYASFIYTVSSPSVYD